jgi:hypothetical protein
MDSPHENETSGRKKCINNGCFLNTCFAKKMLGVSQEYLARNNKKWLKEQKLSEKNQLFFKFKYELAN